LPSAAPLPPLAVLPTRRAKTLHLIRHAEGFHNVAGALDRASYKEERFFDAHLTARGWEQARRARLWMEDGRRVRPGVVLTSPLARALETAVALFGGRDLAREEDLEAEGGLLMRAQDAEPGVRGGHRAVSARGAPPFAAVELARERFGVHPCDRRRPLSGKRRQYPGVDFDAHPSTDHDALWQPDARESEAEIRARAMALLQLVASGRVEEELALVSHASLLRHLLAAAVPAHLASAPSRLKTVRDTEDADGPGLVEPFENAELRTVVLVSP